MEEAEEILVELKNMYGIESEQTIKITVLIWAVRDSVRARLRILIRQLLRKYKYPPDQ